MADISTHRLLLCLVSLENTLLCYIVSGVWCLVSDVWCLWCLVSLENTLSCYIFDQTTCDLNNVYTMTKQGSGHQSLDC